MKFIYVRGGDTSAPKVARKSGLEYGVRHDYKSYAPIYMLDIFWKSYDWADYCAKVERYQPTQAMVADYEFSRQYELMLAQIADLRRLGVPKIMVCPKFDGAALHIPADCIVAVSVPTPEYAGFLPLPQEVKGRKLHLLGGHPDQQAWLIHHYYATSQVVSVDGNIFGRKAGLGCYWSLKYCDWEQAPKRKYRTITLAIYSALCIKKYLVAPRMILNNERVLRCKNFHIQQSKLWSEKAG